MGRSGFVFAASPRSKDDRAIRTTAECARIADLAVSTVVARGLAGRSEREVQQELDDVMFANGADEVSFPTIVATGPNAAEPHHEPGDTVIADGDAVVIDIGACVSGWRSDMTRTVFVGRPRPEVARMWDLVHRAQAAGLAVVRAGVPASEVDEAVRNVFIDNDVVNDYLHLTGHGVGRVIHEHPISGPRCGAVLQTGEVVTVEPGLYRVGVGGVRIEDLVVVTESGCRILTKTPKELSCPPSAPTT